MSSNKFEKLLPLNISWSILFSYLAAAIFQRVVPSVIVKLLSLSIVKVKLEAFDPHFVAYKADPAESASVAVFAALTVPSIPLASTYEAVDILPVIGSAKCLCP